ncbi:MAG TPA: hypothetical protein VEC37_06240 [Bacillota bacterium]|nr:hypothetical protein [Bacillota bacterium]
MMQLLLGLACLCGLGAFLAVVYVEGKTRETKEILARDLKNIFNIK